MLPTNDEIKTISDGIQKTHSELIELGNALEQKQLAFQKTMEAFQEMMKAAREGKTIRLGNQDIPAAIELFAPGEVAGLKEAIVKVQSKENEFNKFGMMSRSIDQLIQAEKVKLEAAKLGIEL
jgi:hypothetical protein